MTGDYLCQYITNDKTICNRSCNRPKGCGIHYKRRQRVPSLECDKLTASDYKLCSLHVKKCHSKAYYHWKKLANMVENYSE
ncbi:3250_t:CDS:1, partial [Entrophospora sp. SA101]